MFHFYTPWFILLLPLPFLVKWLIPISQSPEAGNSELRFPNLQRLKNAFSNHDVGDRNFRYFPFAFLFLSWILIVIALMQPEKHEQYVQEKNKGHDLMLAVDISGSMQAVDFSTPSKVVSRLDATKEVVSKFVLGRHGDRVGLVTFGENAYLHVPLTLDTSAVSQMLFETISGMAGNATAIGDAIGLSVKTLRERPEGSRVIILLTDGEDNASSIPPLEAAKLAKQYGIRIYTIGVGKKGNVPFPTGLGSYQMVNVSIDEELLKKISEITEGQYFLATDQQALQSIYEKIDLLEKTEANESMFLVREPFYSYPLGLAMVFLFCMAICQLLDRRTIYEF